MNILKIVLILLIVLFVVVYYVSGKQAKKTALKKRQLVDKIKNRDRE